jgi:hypothetical protein
MSPILLISLLLVAAIAGLALVIWGLVAVVELIVGKFTEEERALEN